VGLPVLLTSFGGEQRQVVQDPAITMPATFNMPSLAQVQTATGRATHAAAALSGRSPFGMMGVRLAARDGMRAGCRGDLTCMRAVGLYFGTQTGKTEEVAGVIGAAMGVEPTEIGEADAKDLEGFDGLIVGAPTWHTGADEQRSGTSWDDYLEDVAALDLCGKPVAVFGVGDSAGYGDNFCDAIEELHNTFQAAGAKMLGYVDSSDYQHTDSKSVVDGKFLGLPLDEDNENDLTEGRVSKWVEQLKAEGMPR